MNRKFYLKIRNKITSAVQCIDKKTQAHKIKQVFMCCNSSTKACHIPFKSTLNKSKSYYFKTKLTTTRTIRYHTQRVKCVTKMTLAKSRSNSKSLQLYPFKTRRDKSAPWNNHKTYV